MSTGSKSKVNKLDFPRLTPPGKLPVLEMEDGAFFQEPMAICPCLGELHPEPNLSGLTPAKRAGVEMWNRRIEPERVKPTR